MKRLRRALCLVLACLLLSSVPVLAVESAVTVTPLQRLPNDNTIIGNTHAGPDNPQIIEVTRDKKVVWTFKGFDTFGNDVCIAQVLDVPGKSVR